MESLRSLALKCDLNYIKPIYWFLTKTLSFIRINDLNFLGAKRPLPIILSHRMFGISVSSLNVIAPRSICFNLFSWLDVRLRAASRQCSLTPSSRTPASSSSPTSGPLLVGNLSWIVLNFKMCVKYCPAFFLRVLWASEKSKPCFFFAGKGFF